MANFTKIKSMLILLMLFLLGAGSKAQEKVLTSGDFAGLAAFSYTADKSIDMGDDAWLVSTSQLSAKVFYLGCNTNSQANGILSASSWGDVISAIKGVVTSFDEKTKHAYAMQLNTSYNKVSRITMNWSGSNAVFNVYLFVDEGNGLVYKTTAEAASGANAVGSISCDFATPINATRVVWVAIPTTNTKTLRINTYEIKGMEEEAPAIAAPSFSVEAGTYHENQTVTLAAEDGAIIYYTLDGTTPTSSSTVYAQPIAIEQTTTLKAIAVKGADVSRVATAIYTIEKLTTVNSIAALKVLPTGTKAILTLNNAIVTAVGSNDIFVQDATGGLDLYQSGQTYTVGDVLNGKVSGTYTLYKGVPEIMNGNYSGVTAVAGQGATPMVVTIDQLVANPADYAYRLLTLEGVTLENGKLSQENGTQQLDFYDKFNALGVGYIWPPKANITGVLTVFNTSTLQMTVRTEADIVNVSSQKVPELTWSTAEVTVDWADDTYVYPTLTTDSNGELVYSSSDQSVATISDKGAITLVGTGETEIKVIVSETSQFVGATAVYTLKVINSALVPDAGTALIAKLGEEYYAAGQTLTSGKLNAVQVPVVGAVAVASVDDMERLSWDITIAEGGKSMKIQGADARYLVGTKSSTNYTWGTTPSYWTKDETDTYWYSTDANRSLIYSTSSGFGHYAKSNAGTSVYSDFAQPMMLKAGYIRTVTLDNFGTVCLPYDAKAGEFLGAEFYTIVGKRVDEAGNATAVVLSEPVTELRAGVPYIFKATAESFVVVYAQPIGGVQPQTNGLKATMEGINTEKDPENVALEGMYLLVDNQIKKAGKGSSLLANRAYIDMNDVPVVDASVKGLTIGLDPGTVTGIEDVEMAQGRVDVYDVNGMLIRQQVQASEAVQGLPTGVYVVNGKKIGIK